MKDIQKTLERNDMFQEKREQSNKIVKELMERVHLDEWEIYDWITSSSESVVTLGVKFGKRFGKTY